MVRRSPIKIA